MQTNVIPMNGMVISEDTRLAPGTYILPDGLTIAADGITLEGENTLIVSQRQQGVGIQARGRQDVTIRRLSINGFYHGLRLDDCVGQTIEEVIVRGTAEFEGI